jgi:hypothetical protein
VQGHFNDDYRNITRKLIMGFSWAIEYCPKAKFILFSDDDYYVNPSRIAHYLKEVLHRNQSRCLFAGDLLLDHKPVRFHVKKHYISVGEYPYDTWPPYLSGGMYVLAMEVATVCNLAFPYVAPIFVDDAWLGIVCKKLGITPIMEARFDTNDVRPITQDDLNHLFGFQVRTPDVLLSSWRQHISGTWSESSRVHVYLYQLLATVKSYFI